MRTTNFCSVIPTKLPTHHSAIHCTLPEPRHRDSNSPSCAGPRTSCLPPQRRGPASVPVHAFRDTAVPILESECDKASWDLAGEQGGCTRQLSSQLQALPHQIRPPSSPQAKQARPLQRPRPRLDLNSTQGWRLFPVPVHQNCLPHTLRSKALPACSLHLHSLLLDPLSDSESLLVPVCVAPLSPQTKVLAPHSNVLYRTSHPT